MTVKPLAFALVLTSALLSGCVGPFPKIDAQHPGSIETKQSIARGIQNPKIDANGFLVSPWIRNAMMSSFAMRAAHLGIRIDPNGIPVTIHIMSARGRSDDAVMILGYLDGWDSVSAKVDVGDASFDIHGNNFLLWPRTVTTVLDVSTAVGKQLADGIALVGGMPMDDE